MHDRPPHEFHASKQLAAETAEAPWLGTLYRRAFHNFESMMIVRSDGWAQRGGIDRKINLKSARSVHIEEKFRFSDYGDIFLERWSNVAKQTPGWIQQDLLADYVSYVFVPSRRMYLLPYLDLRRAWLRHGRYWIKRYGSKPVPNRGYETQGVPVPIPVLQKALIDCAYLQAKDCADAEPNGWKVSQLAFDFDGGKAA